MDKCKFCKNDKCELLDDGWNIEDFSCDGYKKDCAMYDGENESDIGMGKYGCEFKKECENGGNMEKIDILQKQILRNQITIMESLISIANNKDDLVNEIKRSTELYNTTLLK